MRPCAVWRGGRPPTSWWSGRRFGLPADVKAKGPAPNINPARAKTGQNQPGADFPHPTNGTKALTPSWCGGKRDAVLFDEARADWPLPGIILKLFTCPRCGNAVHFENTQCVGCGSPLGYVPERFEVVTLEQRDGSFVSLSKGGEAYALCGNAASVACNWLVPINAGETFCEACRYNRMIPPLSDETIVRNWAKLEVAKRHLFYSLMRWHLPRSPRGVDRQEGLAFDFLVDERKEDGTTKPVMTGHESGLITINVAEADDAERERRRTAMGEPYRTLIGHFRHEIGHYYWDRLVRDGGKLDGFRTLFGDEREDYGEALKRHHNNGPRPGWTQAFISAYATAHPWEDFAETWAHYIHIVDGLETAEAFGIRTGLGATQSGSVKDEGSRFEPYSAASARELVDSWVPLTIAVNSINRSMGQPDLYPFVISKPVVDKLQFIHSLIHAPLKT